MWALDDAALDNAFRAKHNGLARKAGLTPKGAAAMVRCHPDSSNEVDAKSQSFSRPVLLGAEGANSDWASFKYRPVQTRKPAVFAIRPARRARH